MLNLRELLYSGYVALCKLNLYRSKKPLENVDREYQLKTELISTRLYICLLLLSFTIFCTYTSLVSVTHITVVDAPILEDYLNLYQKYETKLTCPCTNIAIAQRDFISLIPTFHQVCYSDFVKKSWLSYLNAASGKNLSSDFRSQGGVLFQILASFCRLSQDTIKNSLNQFYSTRFISNDVLDEVLLHNQSRSHIETYKSATAKEFVNSFNNIRDVISGNQLLSGFLTNFDFKTSKYSSKPQGYLVLYESKVYNMSGGCNCADTPLCIFPVSINDHITGHVIFVVQGLYTGCLFVEAMRQANLQCLYNQTCLNEINKYIRSSISFNATALNSFAPSRYNTSTDINQLLTELMVESWIENISHSSYYDQCQPAHCVYTIVGKNSAIYIITKLLGLIGGVCKVLYFLTRIVVKIIRRRRVISSFVLLVYTATQTITNTITIEKPSFDRYKTLYSQQHEELSCPCSTITGEYKDFLWITPVFHPVCTSDFVRDKWINYTLPHAASKLGFHPQARAIFHVLRIFCLQANDTISTAIISFNSTKMISMQLLSKEIFHRQIQQFIDTFINSTMSIFSYELSSIRTIIQANFIMSGLNTQSYNYFEEEGSSFTHFIIPAEYGSCSCSASGKCQLSAEIITQNSTHFRPLYTIPGFYVGCYIDEALLRSTLECYFNQSCLKEFVFYLNHSKSTNIMSLDSNMISNFNTTSTVGHLVRNLMVDRWLSNDSFQDYFDKCRPSSCFYTLTIITPFIVAVTTSIGIIGGLIKVLRIAVPLIIKCMRYRKQVRETRIDLRTRIRNLYEKAKHTLRNLNLFYSTESSENERTDYQIKTELISTRLFICVLFISLSILLIYTSQVYVTQTIPLNTTLLKDYESHYEKYAEALICSCTNIAVTQNKFISLTSVFHQVCDSDFVNPRWRNGIDKTYLGIGAYQKDFRFRGASTFAALDSVCSLAKTSITNSLIDFNLTTFISKNLLSQNMLWAQMNASIDLYTMSIEYAFGRSLEIIRDLIHGNGLMSSTLSSLTVKLEPEKNFTVQPQYKTYDEGPDGGECSCHDSPSCNERQYVYLNRSKHSRDIYVPGLLIGCYGFEALLQSNLICFFNQSCIDGLRKAILFKDNFTTSALDQSKLFYFNPNSTIRSMMEKAMVEKWVNSSNYDEYYNQCRPIYCKYTYKNKNNTIYIITTLFALIGGVSTVLRFIVPRFVKLLRKILLRRQQRRTAIDTVA
ncbi:unnamed protein product [Adineta steineri]|uniref:Uncharacterized protein n=1 Tax=Adineta steineri TaxID=433720 RepID=A0A814H7G8_9BILA|nr:unnamed protein product [Adineta steineri]CAF1230900.1 unnamed protein product [Adineta steineri]